MLQYQKKPTKLQKVSYFTLVLRCSLVHYLLILSELAFNSEKGVPDFWLTAMKTNETLAEEVVEFVCAVFSFHLLK